MENDQKPDFLLQVGTSPDDIIAVADWAALISWLEKERDRWTWLVPGDGVTDVFNWASNIQEQWRTLIGAAKTLEGQGQDMALFRASAQIFQSSLLTSISKDGALVQDIQKSNGPEAAMTAYMFLKRAFNLQNANNPMHVRGVLLTALPDLGEPSALADRLQTERRNYRQGVASAIARMDQEERARESRFETDMSRGIALANKHLRRRRDRWDAVQQKWQSDALEAVANIRAVEATYLEAMRLQAPVKYWQGKAAEHSEKEQKALASLFLFFPIAALGMGLIFFRAGEFLLNHQPSTTATSPLAIYFIIAGGLALLSTMVFWVGRLLTKLYLSEHHLANDAAERAIMTETYLALSNEGAATSDADRSIILNALFRATPDGIVKDDGPSDLSVQGLLTRFVSR